MFGRVWEWEDIDDIIIILKEKFKDLNHNYREEICSENSITGYQCQMTDGSHHQILVPPSVFFFGPLLLKRQTTNQDRHMESGNMVNMFLETKLKVCFLAYLENN